MPSYAPVMHRAPEAAAPQAQVRRSVAYQPPLFHEIPQVMPVADDQGARRRAAASVAQDAGGIRAQRPARKAHPDQQSLDFLLPRAGYRVPLEDPAVGCGVPVAGRIHRILAVALDLSVVSIAFGLFLVTFAVAGGSVVLSRETAPFFAAIAGLLAVFYHVLFCLSGGDTPGMRWTSLRLLNFDGHAPTREQRAFRLMGSLLSFLAAGLGLLWSLVDEESLTWHDHMSKTFPTPYGPADTEA
ncbi:MAG: RDD family protein [bacterium]